MATFLNITSGDLVLAAVPARRSFTNSDGSPSFRKLLSHFRVHFNRAFDEDMPRRQVGGYALRSFGAQLRHLAQREQIATGWHPLRATADAFDAQEADFGLRCDDVSRAFAVLALAAGRAALPSHCQNGACILMDHINRGDAGLADLAASPLALAGTAALNSAGEGFLAKARAIAAPAAALAA